jgi:hypothetical protein
MKKHLSSLIIIISATIFCLLNFGFYLKDVSFGENISNQYEIKEYSNAKIEDDFAGQFA